jgi:hypothetical protein
VTAPATTPVDLTRHHLIRRLLLLDFDPDDFVIFGSGPLLAHGLRRQVGDLDVVARGAAWRRAGELGVPTIGPLNGAPMYHFYGGLIEVSKEWVSQDWNVDELIDGADVICGLRFARLEHVLTYKVALQRAKDVADLRVLARYLQVGRGRGRARAGRLGLVPVG